MYTGRILSWVKDAKDDKVCLDPSQAGELDDLNSTQSNKSLSNGGHISHFLPTSRRIVQFSNGKVCSTLFCNFYLAENVN